MEETIRPGMLESEGETGKIKSNIPFTTEQPLRQMANMVVNVNVSILDIYYLIEYRNRTESECKDLLDSFLWCRN